MSLAGEKDSLLNYTSNFVYILYRRQNIVSVRSNTVFFSSCSLFHWSPSTFSCQLWKDDLSGGIDMLMKRKTTQAVKHLPTLELKKYPHGNWKKNPVLSRHQRGLYPSVCPYSPTCLSDQTTVTAKHNTQHSAFAPRKASKVQTLSNAIPVLHIHVCALSYSCSGVYPC